LELFSQNEHFFSNRRFFFCLIGEFFADLREKYARFEKKVPRVGEKDGFFLTIFPSECVNIVKKVFQNMPEEKHPVSKSLAQMNLARK